MKKNKSNTNKPNVSEDIKKMNIIPYFGFSVIANLLVCALIGYYIDKWTFDNKIIFVCFLILGLISGIYNGIKEIKNEIKKYDKKNEEEKNISESTEKK